jgi:putative tricarboxylic transport membrane protein
MIRRDTIAAAAVLGLGASVVAGAARLPFGGVHNPGPGFFPLWLGLVLVLLGGILAIQAAVSRAATGRASGRPLKVLVLLATLSVYVALLEPLGYAAATFLLVLFMLRGLEPHRWLVALAVAVLAAGGSYVLFAVWLGVPLPPGPFAR